MISKRFAMTRIGAALTIAVALMGAEPVTKTPVEQASPTPDTVARPDASVALAIPLHERPLPAPSLEENAARNPLEFLEASLAAYEKNVRDYTCTFTKQELLEGGMSKEQVMKAMFREKPFSVRLEWVKNPDKAGRVLYVADRWSEDGEPHAVVEPAGAIARFFVSYVTRPIHGAEAYKYSRRTIDQFGLKNSLFLTVKYARLAREKDQLKLEYIGKGQVDGRETLVFERRLPYSGSNCGWPDRVLVVNLDKEYRLPTRCEAYADDNKKCLLGRYQLTDIRLNPNLQDSVFTTGGMGLD